MGSHSTSVYRSQRQPTKSRYDFIPAGDVPTGGASREQRRCLLADISVFEIVIETRRKSYSAIPFAIHQQSSTGCRQRSRLFLQGAVLRHDDPPVAAGSGSHGSARSVSAAEYRLHQLKTSSNKEFFPGRWRRNHAGEVVGSGYELRVCEQQLAW